MIKLTYPFSETAVRALKAGDAVSVNGRIRTGRDRFHKYFADGGKLPCDFRDGALFHCGPVVVRGDDGAWRIVAAGPTTSSREEPYMAGIIRREGLRALIGKGGMGKATIDACRECGCAYLQAVGGAAALLARAVKRVADVHFLEEFGATEACWSLEVEALPAIVGIDSTGRSLFEEVKAASRTALEGLLG